MIIHSRLQLEQRIHALLHETPITDIHTHLYSEDFGELLLYGIDELLTYHYLIAETLRFVPLSAESFYDLDKQSQADLVWDTLFVNHSPVSEACRGVLTVLSAMGLDVASRDLRAFREQASRYSASEYISLMFEKSGVQTVVMTNDPLDDKERDVWLNGRRPDPRFQSALRIDPVILHWRETAHKVQSLGYQVTQSLDETCLAEIRRFLTDWIHVMDPLYLAVSLPDTFRFPSDDDTTRIIRDAVLPVCREHNRPFALMIGVRRQVNPALRSAGDAMGKADISSLEVLCSEYPENRFLVTMLSRDNQHELAVVARKFRNLLPFGCWWFLNNPSLVEEITRMRTELLGLSYIPQHSDCRVLDQLLYKWKHSRRVIGKVLIDKYADLMETGWRVSEDELRRDINDLLGGTFWRFLGRKQQA